MQSFSVWHWIIVLAIVVGVIFAVLKTRTPKAATANGGTAGIAEPRGLGGWLVLLVLGQILGIFRVLKAITDDIDLLKDATPQVHAAVVAELTLNAAFLALVAYVTVMMFRQSRAFPGLWKIQAVAAILVPIADAVLVTNLLNVPIARVLDEQAIGQLIGMAIAIGIWAWYLTVSKRVRNTFVK
jgi:hypothetical protein